MNFEEISRPLFGRYNTLLICRAVATLPKDQFSAGELRTLTNVAGPGITRELKALSDAGLVLSRSRRGDYERVGETCFWTFVLDFTDELERRAGG